MDWFVWMVKLSLFSQTVLELNDFNWSGGDLTKIQMQLGLNVHYFFGTGSSPEPPQGWHLAMRFNPRMLPLIIPHSSIAWII